MNTKAVLMSHLVAGYPTEELSFCAAEALIKGGTSILEIQLAFSDPSADGPLIQSACSEVLSNDFQTKDCLNFIQRIHTKYPDIVIFLMSYGSLLYTPGIDNFCKKAAEAGVQGMIIPDLPFDCDEGLTESCKKYGMYNIPVAAPTMTDERINVMLQKNFPYIYAALRTGITGNKTTIDKETYFFISKVSAGGAKILAGFGIKTGEQAQQLSEQVYAIVAGSVYVDLITKYKFDTDNLFSAIEKKAQELSA